MIERWHSMQDPERPAVGNHLVVAEYTKHKAFVEICYFVPNYGFTHYAAKITHWMPLPSLPDMEDEDATTD